MVTYLKSESIALSRERLLKQEEALIELDKSIDDWIIKLEGAENRRLRVRQKLLEHVAAAMTLNAAANSPKSIGQTTPPGSPPRIESPPPLRVERKEVESIKVYADDQVLNLFNDIERAVERMCEAC
jgi:Up-regulated During Septation